MTADVRHDTAMRTERLVVLLVGAVQFVNILDFMMVMPLGPDFAAAAMEARLEGSRNTISSVRATASRRSPQLPRPGPTPTLTIPSC